MNNKVLNTNDKMKDLTILNAFKLSIYQILVFMLLTGQRTIPAIFQRRFIKKITPTYPIRFLEGNYNEKSFKL